MNDIKYEETTKNRHFILIKTFFGDFSVSDIIKAWKKDIKKGTLSTEHTGSILDFTNAVLQMNLKSDVKKLIDYLGSEPDYFEGFKFAIIMHTPSQVTIPFVVERTENIFKSKTFYSLEAGKQWILN